MCCADNDSTLVVSVFVVFCILFVTEVLLIVKTVCKSVAYIRFGAEQNIFSKCT